MNQTLSDPDGFATVYGMRGWSTTPGWPRFEAAAALKLASDASDPAVAAELVWASLPGVSSDAQPFWRVRRASGVEVYVFEDGSAVPATEIAIR